MNVRFSILLLAFSTLAFGVFDALDDLAFVVFEFLLLVWLFFWVNLLELLCFFAPCDDFLLCCFFWPEVLFVDAFDAFRLFEGVVFLDCLPDFLSTAVLLVVFSSAYV